jgi:hypothetical protein
MKCSECKYRSREELNEVVQKYFCLHMTPSKTITCDWPDWCPLRTKQEDTNDMYPKPKLPLGLMPRTLWLDAREQEVGMAIQRYLDEGFEIPLPWVEEYNDLVKRSKA